MLLALAAPAGLVLAGEPSRPYVVLFDQKAVGVPVQAVNPALSGGLGEVPTSNTEAPGDGSAVDPRRVVSHLRQIAALTGMRSVTDVYTSAVGGFSARLTPSQLRVISADPAVVAVLPDEEISLGPVIAGETAGGIRTTANPTERVPAGVRRVGARSTRVIGLTARGRAIDADVALLDTGVQRNHPDLNVVGGYNCTGRNRDKWDDANGHGTHVAGIVGALDNRIGVTGVSPGARLWSVKVLNDEGHGFLSWLVCGVDWVTAQQDRAGRPLIEVANLSLTFRLPGGNDAGCGEPSGDSLHQAICRSVARGIVYVVAAGNNSNNARRYRPAAYDEVITVSAMADYDGRSGGRGRSSDSCPYWSPDVDDGFASFSNYGPDVDLIAPGRCIVSTFTKGRYAWMSGTSMATPHVAGAAAIYRSMYPRATPQQVRMALEAVGKLDWRTGTDPDGTHEKALWIGQFRAAPDFAMSASLTAAIASPGSVVDLVVAFTRVGGFADAIAVTLSGAPRGITARSSLATRGGTNLRLEIAPNVKPGRYTLTVDAQAGGLSRTATISLIVRGAQAARASFTSPKAGLTLSPDGRVAVSWDDGVLEAGAGQSRLQRESARIPAPGTCAGASYSADYSRSPAVESTEQLRDGRCYRWRLTATDSAGGSSSAYSGEVLVDRTAPRPPSVTLTAEAARAIVDGLGVNAAYVGHSGTLWVRAGAAGSVLVNVDAFDPESGISGNVAVLDGRSGWRATWIGASADGALRLSYLARGGDAALRVSSINGTGLEGSATLGTLRRDGDAPDPVRWTSAASDSTQRITGSTFRLAWTGGDDHGSGLAARHVIARYRAGLTPDGECRVRGFSTDGGFRLAGNRTLETGLEPGACYVWSVRTLDNVGNSSVSMVSGYVITAPRR